ncbi:MAG: hypothetical protein JWO86_1146 [Myxococcaceae bacterium]|nr:hypothetical protein [Myxococcaceae bacterium]
MTYREPAHRSPALVRPPQILGFAFYVLGTGCVALAVAQLATFAENLHAIPFSPVSIWSFVVGEAMVLLGLAIGWRATKGYQRRLLGVAATLWLTLFVLEMQRERTVTYLLAHAPSALGGSIAASFVGRAIVLCVVALVVHASGRAFAARTWATTLGATLVFADAWAGAWPVVTRVSFTGGTARLFHTTPSMLFAGIGLLVMSGGLYAAGRTILSGITTDEYRRAHPRRVDPSGDPAKDASPPPDLGAGLPLFADAAVAIAGLAIAHAVSLAASSKLGISMHDIDDTSTLGGELFAWTLMVVALRRMKPLTARAATLALLAAGALVAVTALRYVLWSNGLFAPAGQGSLARAILPVAEVARWVLVIVTLFAVTKPLAPYVRSSRFARVLAFSVPVSLLAVYGRSAVGAGPVEIAFAVLLGAFALYAAIGMAREVRRAEVDLT